VALRLADRRLLVGPDNGLLSLAADAAGGVVEAVDIANSPFRLEPVSATFHGRDIFAPVAAQLAAGIALAEVGQPCDPDGLVRLELPQPRIVDGALVAHALYVDRFGNVQLEVGHEQLAQTGLKLGQRADIEVASQPAQQAQYAWTFADVAPGQLLIYEDAYRRLAVAVSHGDAARLLGVSPGDEVRISPT
jgi:S-adenosylmethionine hydrolase